MTIKQTHSMVISVVLGVFFIVSGVGKMMDVSTFIAGIVSYGIPDKLAALGILLPTFEILLGLALIFMIRNKDMALVSLVALIVFTLGFAYGYFFEGVEDCGCFGAIEALQTPPWVSFLRNIILIGMSFLLWKNPVKSKGAIPQWQWAAMVVALLVSGIWSGQTSVDAVVNTGVSADGTPDPSLALNDPLMNKNVSQTALASLTNFEANRRYLVFIFSPTCPHCWDATENVKAYKETGLVDEVIGVIAVGSQGLEVYNERFRPNFEVRQVPTNDILRLTEGYPKALFIRNNTVMNIQYANIKSPWTMYQSLR